MRKGRTSGSKASPGTDRAEDRRTPGPDRKEYRRWLLGGICERCGCRSLRHRGSAGDGRAQCPSPAGEADRVPGRVNLGDVIAEEHDIFGNGVNVAARLKALAEPGGICVSRVVRDQIRDKVDFVFDDMGEQHVKNITRPVRAYRIGLGQRPPAPASAALVLALPDKPSIAVLPFQNMSGDPEQEYFADGMVEEIITALSRIRWLFVIARNSSFTYKGQAIDVKQVGR